MWHRFFVRFCGRFYFSACTVRGREHVPAGGPLLWLALHRNGAVDGFAYAAGLRRPLVFLISTQLRKNFLARIFFDGIAVARNASEGGREANRAALAECGALLRGGGELFIFPEGTSSLGPRHLPFKGGAAQIVLDWLEREGAPPLAVVPLGVHYDCPWAFRSRVEVSVGPAVGLTLPAEGAQLGRLREIKRRMTEALEGVGTNFTDALAQREAESLATLAALACGHSRFAILKACEGGSLGPALAAWRMLDAAAEFNRGRRYHGVPLVPVGATLGHAVAFALLGPLVAAGIALNVLPWCVAAWAAQKFPDDTNVISLWKILAGLPVLSLWIAAFTLALAASGAWCGLAIYAVLTGVAWAGYDQAKRLGVLTFNGWFHRELRAPFAAVVAALSAELPR